MNKNMARFLEEKNLTIHDNYAYGVLHNYETNFLLRMMDNVAPVSFHFSCYTTDEQKRQIAVALNNAKIKFFKYQFSLYGLSVGLNDITLNALLKRLDSVLEQICTILTENGALGVGFCPVCGNELDFSNSKKCQIDGFTVSIDNNCVENINAVITEENKDFDAAPNNYFKGFLGALVGGIAGAVISIILYAIGFISAISAFVAFLVGIKLYQAFGGKANKVMILIVSLTTVVAMVLSVMGIYIYTAVILLEEEGLAMSMFQSFSYCMQFTEFSTPFYQDLIMNLLFTALGCGFEIYAFSKKVKRKTNI